MFQGSYDSKYHQKRPDRVIKIKEQRCSSKLWETGGLQKVLGLAPEALSVHSTSILKTSLTHSYSHSIMLTHTYSHTHTHTSFFTWKWEDGVLIRECKLQSLQGARQTERLGHKTPKPNFWKQCMRQTKCTRELNLPCVPGCQSKHLFCSNPLAAGCARIQKARPENVLGRGSETNRSKLWQNRT